MHLDYLRGVKKDRAQMKTQLLDELFAHTPAQAMRFMRRWPGGALSLIHLNVITVLEADGPLGMRQLAEALDVSQASATGIVDRMEQRGLVTRNADADDRRVTRVALTEEGHAFVTGMMAERRDKMARLLDELTDKELSGFLRGTRAMRLARERLYVEHEGKPG